MPMYSFVAKDTSGKVIKGSQEAANKAQVYSTLKQKELTIVNIAEKGLGMGKGSDINLPFLNKVKVKDIAIFCRQFATILRAGVPVLRCIDILRKQAESKVLKETLNNVYENLQKGSVLSEAMRQQKKVFPSILINMIEAGEISGTLDASLDKMAVHFEKDFKIRQKVKSAMTYPIIVSIIAVAAVMVLLTFVIPQFAGMFETLGVKLPVTTQFLLNSGNFMKSYWYVVIAAIIALVIGFMYFKRSSYGRRLIDEYCLKLPIISQLIRKIIASRFTRTMATMLGSGIPLMKALEVTEKVIGNAIAEDVMKKVKEDVIKGGGLAEPMASSGLFPVMVPQMISIGEESGAIDKMLEKTADFYDEEVDAAITQMTTMLEPAILLVMAAAVGFIVISIVQPMFSIFQGLN